MPVSLAVQVLASLREQGMMLAYTDGVGGKPPVLQGMLDVALPPIVEAAIRATAAACVLEVTRGHQTMSDDHRILLVARATAILTLFGMGETNAE